MRYLRMLSNSVLAGGIAAAYLTILFLQLNPSVVLGPGTVGRLYLAVALSYGVHFAVVFYAAIVVRQLLGHDVLSPGWVSLRLLAWLCAASGGIGVTLMWLNLRGLRPALDDRAAAAMAAGAAVLTGCTLVFLTVAVVRYSLGGRTGRLVGTVFAAALAASLVAPLALRGPGEPPPLTARRLVEVPPSYGTPSTTGRVLLLVLDGASLDFISPAAADGRLPHFGRMLDGGAVMHLATLRPTQPAPVLSAMATGKLPSSNGIRSAAVYTVVPGGPSLDVLPDYCFAHALVYVGFLAESSHTPASLRARTLWSILGASGVGVGIIRWPVTYPAQPVRGYLVSDRFHRTLDPTLALDEPQVAHPPELVATLRTAAVPAVEPAAALALPPEGDRRAAMSAVAAVDRLYAGVLRTLEDRTDVQLVALRYRGIDSVGHYFLRQAMPRAFGDVSEEERRRFGRVLESYYRYIDAEVGRAMDRLGPEDLLLVASGFGLEPISVPKRLLERTLGNPDLSGTHERAPDGFLIAYGAAVRPGRLTRASVTDVTPTILYYFGLPIGRDMDGFARTDLFSRSFTAERPLTFIPSYDR